MKFRLQRVLDLRHAQEKIAQQELATRQQDYQAILGRLDQLLEDESTLFELIKRQDDSSIYLPKIQHLYTYSAELSRELSEQEVKRQESLEQVEQQREAVKECWQRRRMLEIQQAKADVEFKEMVGKEEQDQLDELVLFSFTESSFPPPGEKGR
ncbi:MAG: hypothetical protein WBK58_02840 [Dethiobacteria bacterium]